MLPTQKIKESSASGIMEGPADRDQPEAADGFDIPDLEIQPDAPPAYGDHHDQLHLSQMGFQAGAAVTDDGRVNININQTNQTNHRVSDFLAPALRSQLVPKERPSGVLPPPYIPPGLGGDPRQVPPPKLNVVIQIVGSRGDVQPFVALGKVLKETYGHRVRLATHATFQKFVEENGLEFFSIGGDPAELMAFMVKHPGLMPGFDAIKSGEIKKRREGIEEILLGCWRSCIEAGNGLGPPPRPHRRNEPFREDLTLAGNPAERPFVADVIIANPPSFAHIHIAEKLGIPLHMMFTMPWSPTRAFPHPLANIQSTNTDVVMTNYVSYALVEMMTWQGLGDVINRFREKALDIEPLSLIWAPGILSRLRIPTTYCWSPALISKPNDWSREISIAGFYFLNLASSYTPEPDLAAFLENGPPPVYIGFGSIVVDDPNHLTRMIFDAISIAGVRALVSKGWGGIGADSVGIPDGVFMLGNCPHDWLFQHVSAVVHHGGAGTTAAGIKLGKPTVVVPFFGDQPFWGSMIAKAGAGPEPIPYKDLTAESLAEAIRNALQSQTQGKAKELGERIREEKGTDTGAQSFHQFLDTDSLRCSIAPSRAAVWRVRRSKLRLSALAATVLVRRGILKWSDLKLYRSQEYQTEDQPWDPISAVVASLMGDISGLTMAVADFPREMFKAKKKKITSEDNASTDELATVPSINESSSDLAEQASVSQVRDGTPGDNSLRSADASASTTSLGASTQSLATPTESSGQYLSPTQTSSSEAPMSTQSQKPLIREKSSSPSSFDLEAAVGAGKGASRIVGLGMKTPMNFCLGLARGFRNAPRLYNDDTIRPQEKVTDFASGVRVASKEFGLGFYDGLSGLVTQPLKGAEKEGSMGLLKGFGKGVGGLVLKPAAAVWSIPAYTMQGVHAEVRSYFARSVQNYIITSRVLQGQEDLDTSTPEEQEDIILRWGGKKRDLKSFYQLKQHMQKRSGEKQSEASSSRDGADKAPQTGWLHTRNLSLDERKKLHADKEAWKKRQMDAKFAAQSAVLEGIDENDEFERAIRDSVLQTSKGDKDEDAEVEGAIRASIREMRRIADLTPNIGNQGNKDREDRGLQVQPHGEQQIPAEELTGVSVAAELAASMPERADLDISDEEYQALIEEAVRRSLMSKPTGIRNHAYGSDNDDDDHGEDIDDEFLRAIEASKFHQQRQSGVDGGVPDDDLELAIRESEKAHREQLERDLSARNEEDVVMEYVKKQSLAEEEYRRKTMAARGKMTHHGISGSDGNEDDEDLRRALEESLQISSHGSGGGGPSAI